MLAERDIKVLRAFRTAPFRIGLGFLLLFAVFQAYFAYHHVSLALEYARAIGLDLRGTLQMWNAEPELHKLYSGFEVQSLHRLNMAILSIGSVLFAAILVVSLVLDRSHKRRVLAELERVGAIGKGESQATGHGGADA